MGDHSTVFQPPGECRAVLLLLHRKSPFPARQQLIFWGISATVVVSSIPLMVDYLFFGADLIFHLGRIEALAQALLSGMPFSRIEPMWLAGHGYANSIFYCDTFLLFPAILRMAGFPLTISYQCYVTAVNLATALIAYTAFKRCFQSAEIGLLGCMLYTLSPYRLYNIYNRASVGEYTAMIFLPLLAWGFLPNFFRRYEGEELQEELADSHAWVFGHYTISCTDL